MISQSNKLEGRANYNIEVKNKNYINKGEFMEFMGEFIEIGRK